MKHFLIIAILAVWPAIAAAENLFVVPTYDGSLMWEANVDKLLTQIYDDLRQLIKPAEGRISSEFGMREHPILGITRHHNGIDFACGVGTPIKAVLAGVVRRTGRSGGYGRLVEIAHSAANLKSRYAHLSKIVVKEGQKVNRGDVIGFSGQSGLATGPHLHFELFRNGVAIDPELMLGRSEKNINASSVARNH